MRPGARTLIAIALLAGVLVGSIGLWSLQREVESRFRGELFSVPSRVYARPLVLRPGLDVTRIRVVEQLRRLGYRRVESREVSTQEFSVADDWIAFGPAQSAEPTAEQRPERVVLEIDRSARIVRVADGRGRRLAQAVLEPELVAEIHGPYRARRRLIALDDVPTVLVDAVLATEDHRFFDHWGLDVRRIAGASLANLRARRIVQGGSTITQQLVKNFYLSPDRTLRRKAREAVMAILLERGHTKQEILEAYLNEIYLGQRGPIAIHGVGEASAHYFGKDLADITLAESALLAGMIAAPGRYSPFADVDAAKERRDLVLGLLYTRGHITPEEFARALHEPISVESRFAARIQAPHFVDALKRELAPDITAERLQQEGMRIDTTLDARLQRFASSAVDRGLAELERSFPHLLRDDEPLQAALVALDPKSGDVLAYVGGRDYSRSQFDRAAQAQRQPGSVFKPVVALAALSRASDGQPTFTLASHVEDSELSVETREGEWTPVNFDREFRGPVTLREAIELSLNVPTVRVGLAVGPERIVETARRLGIESRLEPVPSLALGSFEVTPLEMTRAYAALAADGELPTARAIRTVRDQDGNVLIETRGERHRAFDAAETFLVTSALRGVVDRGTGSAVRALEVPGPMAGKTGTTNDFRDAWFIGYTRDLVAGVWVGFDDGESLKLPASVIALPVFARFMREAVGPYGADPFERPRGVEIVSVEVESGKRAGPGCWGEREVFLAGSAPDEICRGSAWKLARRPLEWLRGRLRLGGPPRSDEEVDRDAARLGERDGERGEDLDRRGDRRGEKRRRGERNPGAASPEEGAGPGWHGGVWIGDPNRYRRD